MASSSPRPISPIIAGPEVGYIFVESYGICVASTMKYHQDLGCTVYDNRGRIILPSGPPFSVLPKTEPYMIFVPNHGIFKIQTATQHLALGRYVFDHIGLPLRPIPSDRLINADTRAARDNRATAREPGRGLRPLGGHLDVDQASRAVEDNARAEDAKGYPSH